MLADAAHDAGVVEQRDYAIFQNYGYKGLVHVFRKVLMPWLATLKSSNVTYLLRVSFRRFPVFSVLVLVAPFTLLP